MDEKLKRLLEYLKGTAHRKTSLAKTSSIDQEQRKISFIAISNDNAGKRFSWERGVYIEVLDANGANYNRLRVFLKDHENHTDSAIGRIENKRVEKNQLKLDVVFGTDEQSNRIFRKYCEGILTDCSISYMINKAEIEERSGEPDIVTVTDFDILECSAVGIGFDKGAMVGRNLTIQGDEPMNEKLKKELESLRAMVDGLTSQQEKRKAELEKKEQEEKRKANNNNGDYEKDRAAQIMALVASGQITAQRALQHINEGDSINSVYRAIIEKKTRESQAVVTVRGRPDEQTLRSSIENAMMARVGLSVEPSNMNDIVKRFKNASLHEMAREYLGINTYDKMEIAQRAMSSSDFPLLLGNIGNKVLADTFEETQSTYQLWTKAEDLPDFKERTEITLNAGNGRLKKLGEKSEIKNSEFSEGAETWKIESFGDSFMFTREMIINDDLNAFSNMLMIFSEMAKRTSNGRVYDMLQSKGDYKTFKMSDKKAIFAKEHLNLASPASGLTSKTLTSARTAMRRQEIDGKALNIHPKFLLVSPEDESLAKKILGSEADVGSTNSNEMNPHKNAYDLIIEAELDSNAWYLMAKNQIKVGYLQGTNRNPIVKATQMGLTGTKFECVYDFGVGVMNYRGLYKNAGK